MKPILTALIFFFILTPFVDDSSVKAISKPVVGDPVVTEWIRIDQFGYLPDAPKVVVVSKPSVGFNAPGDYDPGDKFSLVRLKDGIVIWSGSPELWKDGMIHEQSGDRGWWIDFSQVVEPGEYFLLDIGRNLRSHRIRIGENVYDGVLVAAMRTFYYQRLNQAKEPQFVEMVWPGSLKKKSFQAKNKLPFIDKAWADKAAYDGPGQDREATSRFRKGDPVTARDLHGGWMDAGDPNKYTTNAEFVVIGLLQTYESRPDLFGDDTDIPESWNGIPDILDEVKYELDFLGRMQDASGTGGVFLKVGVDNYNSVVPLSRDTRPRYYLPECTSSTLAGAGMFAMAAIVYSKLPATAEYGAELLDRAWAAWKRAKYVTQGFTTFQTDCDDLDIKSGDADRSTQEQLESSAVAAVFLFEATGNSVFRNFVYSVLDDLRPISNGWWGPYYRGVGRALLRFAGLPGVDVAVANRIRSSKARMNNPFSITDYKAKTDLYRAYIDNNSHHWGSNSVRSSTGSLNLEFIEFGINKSYHQTYRKIALGQLNWLHGTNPLGRVMLSNMYNYGAALCVNEFYHSWFADGSDWDNVFDSKYGPPPGYLVGGPNKNYTGQMSPPGGQPPQKSYLDWNGGWPENSWEITENSIYYQAAYIELLARLIPS